MTHPAARRRPGTTVLTSFALCGALLVTAAAAPSTASVAAASTGGSVATPGRVAGADRVETAVAVSRDRFADRGATSAVVASSRDFADALAGTPLAEHVGGPLLLTSGSGLDARVAAELTRVVPTGSVIHLLGGTSSLDAATAAAVAALGFTVDRIAGADRYDTAAAVSRSMSTGADGSCHVYVATGTDFADGVSASGATTGDTPLLFTAGDRLPEATRAELARCARVPGADITAVGGWAASALGSDPSVTAGADVTSVVGDDRYATAAAVMAQLLDGRSTTGVVMASGLDYPDALVGGTYGEAVLLARPGSVPGATRDALTAHRSSVTGLKVVGGTASISDATARDAAAALAGVELSAGIVAGGVPRQSGLPWNSGVYTPGRGSDADAAFAEWRGNPLDVSIDATGSATWKDIVDPSWLYRDWAGTTSTLVMSVPMLPDDGSSTLATCAAGTDDAHWSQFARGAADSGLAARLVVRLGWEFNGDWMRWRADDPALYAECWRRVVTVVERTAPELRWDWTVNRGPGQALRDAREAYPGDAYVDIVGVDSYDAWPGVVDEATWQEQFAGEFGLAFWADFAAERGKPFSVPEWGVYPGTAQAGHNGGDNAFYVAKMADFFQRVAPNLAYEAYFNESAPYYAGSLQGPTQNPAAAQEYLRRW